MFRVCALVAILVVSMWSGTLTAEDGTLSASAVKVDVTPQTRIPMSGYGGRKDPFQAVHDPIFARVLAFSDGKQNAAIVTVDVIGLSHDFWEGTSQRIQQSVGIPPKYFLLCPTHNHGGPTTRVYSSNPSPEVESYVAELQSKIATAVEQAIGDLEPVRIGAGLGECRMNINRRARHPNGEITLGRNPYGPCDYDVGVVKIDDVRGDPISLLFNWACHGTVMGPRNYEITGDWPGAASRFVEDRMAKGITAPVTIGASGNINPIYGPHIDFHDVRSYSYGVDAIGMILGEEVIRVAAGIETQERGSIAAAQQVVRVPAKNGSEPGLPIRLTVLKMGHIVFAGISGEVFTEIGMQIKKDSPYKHTFVVTHCNGSSGYLVTDRAYAEGGYEARATRAQSGAEKAIVENVTNMIREL